MRDKKKLERRFSASPFFLASEKSSRFPLKKLESEFQTTEPKETRATPAGALATSRRAFARGAV